jgi:hypothetical protein
VSRAIQVRIRESVTRVVHVEDGVVSPLEMLPILAPDRMAELLAGELVGQGFARDGRRCTRIEPDGTVVTVDLEAATIAVTLGAGARLDESIELSAGAAVESQQTTEARLRDDAARRLDDQVAARVAALQREITAQLEARLADLKRELDGAIGRATIAALTEKASQLGRIEELHEDAAGNVTIRVRL